MVGGGAAIAFGRTDFAPLDHAAPLLQTLIVGLAFAVATIYVSSLIDWYWIVSKISGAVGPGPCEQPGQERWAGVTNILFFHRAVATAAVIGVLAAVPGYMAGISHSGSLGAGFALLGGLLSIGYSSVNTGVSKAFVFTFNPPVHIGDVIAVRREPTDATLRKAVIVDVSIQGAKYKILADETSDDPHFTRKGLSLTMEELSKIKPLDDPPSSCSDPDHCQAVNWYCCRNPRANGSWPSDDGSGRPLP